MVHPWPVALPGVIGASPCRLVHKRRCLLGQNRVKAPGRLYKARLPSDVFFILPLPLTWLLRPPAGPFSARGRFCPADREKGRGCPANGRPPRLCVCGVCMLCVYMALFYVGHFWRFLAVSAGLAGFCPPRPYKRTSAKWPLLCPAPSAAVDGCRHVLGLLPMGLYCPLDLLPPAQIGAGQGRRHAVYTLVYGGQLHF